MFTPRLSLCGILCLAVVLLAAFPHRPLSLTDIFLATDSTPQRIHNILRHTRIPLKASNTSTTLSRPAPSSLLLLLLYRSRANRPAEWRRHQHVPQRTSGREDNTYVFTEWSDGFQTLLASLSLMYGTLMMDVYFFFSGCAWLRWWLPVLRCDVVHWCLCMACCMADWG